jgi:hypothetical protein
MPSPARTRAPPNSLRSLPGPAVRPPTEGGIRTTSGRVVPSVPQAADRGLHADGTLRYLPARGVGYRPPGRGTDTSGDVGYCGQQAPAGRQPVVPAALFRKVRLAAMSRPHASATVMPNTTAADTGSPAEEEMS